MLTLYCDDSGTHADSDIAVAACFISPVEQWKKFAKQWKKIAQQEGFDVFHTADFNARQQQFASPEWQDNGKRNRTYRALIDTIKQRTMVGLGVAVEKAGYDQIVPAAIRDRIGKNHYTFALYICMGFIKKWREEARVTEPIQFVFDRVSKGKGEIDSYFETLVSGGDHARVHFGVQGKCWSFRDKAEAVQLQAADIWAYEFFRFMRDCYSSGQKEPRKSLLSLALSPKQFTEYHNRETLTEFVRRLQETSSQQESAAQASSGGTV